MTNEAEEIAMYRYGLAFTLIVFLTLISGAIPVHGSDCAEQKVRLEQAMREMGMLSEEEIQSRLDEVQQICDEYGDNLSGTVSSDQSESAQKEELPMSELTADYLAGKWCGVTGKQERGPWIFLPNGSYQVGIPAGNGYSMRQGGDSVGHFRERFDRLASRSDDTFTVFRFHHETVFQRGDCE